MAAEPGQRANEQWLRDLRREGAGGLAAGELRGLVRGGLRKALATRFVSDDDLDDFTQDSIVRILTKLDTFRGDSRFTTWAMAVAVRVALGSLRRRSYRSRVEEVETEAVESAADRSAGMNARARALEQRHLMAALQAAIRERLTERQRAAVVGELEGVPSDELAERLGITRNALYKLHHDARRKLRQAIADRFFRRRRKRRAPGSI